MLLTTLKFAAVIWLALLVTSILVLGALFVFEGTAAVIRRRLARRP